MRILLLSTGGKIGGEETFTRNLALYLIQRGHNVEVCPGGEMQKMDLMEHAIPVCDLDISGRSPFAIIKASKALSVYSKEKEFQIIHAQSVGPALMGVFAKRLFGCNIPWVWHNHGITSFAYKWIVPLLDHLDLCVSNSDYVYVMLRSHGISKEKCKRIHNGISIPCFSVSEIIRLENRSNLLNEFMIPFNDKIITYVGRLSPEKGVIHLLKAFEKEYIVDNNISLLIVGDGDQRESLESFKKDSIAGNKIHFAGFRKDIKALLSGSDVLVLPSLIETFSLTVLQSFAVCTPVVASDVGGTPEQIIDRFNGLLFKSQDEEELREKIHMITHDYSSATRFARNARALAENYFNSDRMTDEIEMVYIDLINRK